MIRKKIRILGLILSVVAMAAFFMACGNPAGPSDARADRRNDIRPSWNEAAIRALFHNGIEREDFGPITLTAAGIPAPTFEITGNFPFVQSGDSGETIAGQFPDIDVNEAYEDFTFTVRARNRAGATAPIEITIRVYANPPCVQFPQMDPLHGYWLATAPQSFGLRFQLNYAIFTSVYESPFTNGVSNGHIILGTTKRIENIVYQNDGTWTAQVRGIHLPNGTLGTLANATFFVEDGDVPGTRVLRINNPTLDPPNRIFVKQ